MGDFNGFFGFFLRFWVLRLGLFFRVFAVFYLFFWDLFDYLEIYFGV